ncbi:hypothetical protein PV327_009359 [Microctonus hyperodae]|uniref:COMM domain-containing protein 3 n=1 Tax=Microctonus hyperodae TaxID=165561 RepID=A0AA39FTM3_MICHY|nr:hypothetical protein PV327_009359 [Microctonus hyperodae]
MELSNISIDILNILLNSTIVSDEHFDELLSNCCKALTIIRNSNVKYVSSEFDEIKLSRIINAGIAYGNIFGLFVEAARHKYDSKHFINFLHSSNIFHGSRTEKLSIAYEKQRELLICHLANIGNNSSCIVGVNWELDYCIKKSTSYLIASSFYHINITIKKYGIINCVKFTCTRHQLQELVYKLRDIIRHIEKISHT